MQFVKSSHKLVFLFIACLCNAKKTIDFRSSIEDKVTEKLVSMPDETLEAKTPTAVVHTSSGSGIGTDLYSQVNGSALNLNVSLPPTRTYALEDVQSSTESSDGNFTLCNVTVTVFSTNSSNEEREQNCSTDNGWTSFCGNETFLVTFKGCLVKDWSKFNCTDCVASLAVRISPTTSGVDCGSGRRAYQAGICVKDMAWVNDGRWFSSNTTFYCFRLLVYCGAVAENGNCEQVERLIQRCVEKFWVQNERSSAINKLLPLWIVLVLLGVVMVTGLLLVACLGKRGKYFCSFDNDHVKKEARLSPVLGVDNPTLEYSTSSLPPPSCGTFIYEEPDRKQSTELSPEDEERINNGITPYEDDQAKPKVYMVEGKTKL